MVKDINLYIFKGNDHTSNYVYKNHLSRLYSRLSAIMFGDVAKKTKDGDGVEEYGSSQLSSRGISP